MENEEKIKVSPPLRYEDVNVGDRLVCIRNPFLCDTKKVHVGGVYTVFKVLKDLRGSGFCVVLEEDAGYAYDSYIFRINPAD